MINSILLCTVLSCFVFYAQSAVDVNVQNKNVDRTIDLTSQNVKISYKISLAHKDKLKVSAYDFLLLDDQRSHLAFISIKDSAKKELKYVEEKSKKGVTFTVNLPASNSPPANVQVLYIETVFTKSITPYPTHIEQNDRQLVRYFGSAYFYSPYTTLTQKTTIHLSSKNVESYTTVKPSSQSDTTLTYGPYDNIPGKIRTPICIIPI